MISQSIYQTSLVGLLDWVSIPGGLVTVTSAKGSSTNYIPIGESQTTSLDSFTIAKYPITNGQFQQFFDASDGYANVAWWDFSNLARAWREKNLIPLETAFPGEHLPRTNLSWYDALAFCNWLSNQTGQTITLPTERQWQRAAQGDTQQAYTWGDEFDSSECNSSVERPSSSPTAVSKYPNGTNCFGVVGMCGNVWEWCLTKYETGGIELNGADARVLRGGSWQSDHPTFLRVDFRNWRAPDKRLVNRGLRPVCL